MAAKRPVLGLIQSTRKAQPPDRAHYSERGAWWMATPKGFEAIQAPMDPGPIHATHNVPNV